LNRLRDLGVLGVAAVFQPLITAETQRLQRLRREISICATTLNRLQVQY